MATLEITDDLLDYDVGDLGEAEFDRWCIKAGIVANRTQRDRKGWDFIIELPADAPRFKHDEITAKVQVKATKSGAESARIKLDNVARMATDPVPWFVLYYAFDDAGEILSAHMMHVDEQFVANAHNVIGALKSADLHKTRIRLHWADQDRIDHASPRELLDRVRSAVGGSMWSYHEAKARWNTAALMRRISGSLSFPGSRDEAYERLADLAVGLVDEIPVDVIEMVDALGGNLVPEGAVIESSVISIEARNPEPATIEGHFGTERVVLKCSMLTSGFLKELPAEHHKARVFTELLSVIISARGLSMHIDIPPRAVPLSMLAQTGRLVRLLANPGAKLTLRAEHLLHTVEVADHKGRGGSELRDTLAWERAARIANHVGLPLDLEVLPSLMIMQKNQIASFVTLLDSMRPPDSFVVELHDQKASMLGEAAVVIAPKVVLGDYGAVALGAVRGLANVAGGKLVIEQPRLEPMRIEVRHRSELTRDYLASMISEAFAALKAQTIPIITMISKTPFSDEA